MAGRPNSIGRAKTVLVFGDDHDPVGVISTITSRAYEKEKLTESLRHAGPVSFSEATPYHIQEIILPIVNNILDVFDLPRKGFEISVVNLNATAALDIGMDISGFSADVPVFLALLSSALKITVPDDIVFTGHIASRDGDIKLVKNLQAKIHAAVSDPCISEFICPGLESDISCDKLSPHQKDEIEEAILQAKKKIRVLTVDGIEDLLKAVFTDEAIVRAGLQTGFFGGKDFPDHIGGSVLQCAQFLGNANESRFWKTLEKYLFEGNDAIIKDLLLRFVEFFIDQKRYPPDIGYKLTRLIQSMPAGIRRIKVTFPLIPMDYCIKLTQFATPSDHEDIKRLYDVAFGKQEAFNKEETQNSSAIQAEDYLTAFDMVLEEINEETLARKISLPIDNARAGFVMDSVTIKSNEEFLDIISSFYVHLLRYTHSSVAHIETSEAEADAIALLEESFTKSSGFNAALAEAQSGIKGGMRFILDAMTETYKKKEQEKYINAVLKKSIDNRKWEEKVLFIKAFLKRFASHLPDEIKSQDPRKYATHYEEIARVYVNSLDRVKQFLHQL